MTRFLCSEENPGGHKLEELLNDIRSDVITRCSKIVNDPRVEAKHVLKNNMRILTLLTEAVELAEDSTHVLDKAFGPSQAGKGGPPRIGEE